jgi:adenylate cyclase, class 2
MAAGIEREIKLRFDDADAARMAVIAAGATPLRGRRLQEDNLLDTPDEALRRCRSVLRVRMEPGHSLITFKGPVQPSPFKLREELETIVNDGPLILSLLERLGFHVWFRYEKYREEFTKDDVIVAVDETPVGTYVEIEGEEGGIAAMAEALGRSPDDYLLDSYRGLFTAHCRTQGLPLSDMLFEHA